MTTKQDIESEIGKNGWRLVGKISISVGGILLVPLVLGSIWIGALDNRVETNSESIKQQDKAIAQLQATLSARAADQAVVIERIEGLRSEQRSMADRLSRILDILDGRDSR